jgi:hypothetical protein
MISLPRQARSSRQDAHSRGGALIPTAGSRLWAARWLHADDFWRTIVSTVLRLIADAAWSDDDSTFPILLIFASLGLLVSLLAALNGFEIADI